MLHIFLTTDGLTINKDKSEFMLLSPKSKNIYGEFDINVNHKKIKQIKVTKLFSIMLNINLHFSCLDNNFVVHLHVLYMYAFMCFKTLNETQSKDHLWIFMLSHFYRDF